MKVTELVAGDTILGWMKLGIALVPKRTKSGELQYTVPVRLRRAVAGSLTAFTGVVVRNDVASKVLGVQVAPMSASLRPFRQDTSAIVSIHYSAFKRIRLLSQVAYEPREQESTPVHKAPFSGTAFKPYRTLIEVEL